MYSIYLALLIAAAISAFVIARLLRSNKSDRILGCFCAPILVTIICCAGGAVGGLIIDANLPDHTVDYGTYTLEAMHSTDSQAGSFVAGTGSISGVIYDYVTVKNDDGSLTQYCVQANNATKIIEDPTLQNQGRWHHQVVKTDYSGPWGAWAIGGSDYTSIDTFTVPVGSVVQDFKVK